MLKKFLFRPRNIIPRLLNLLLLLFGLCEALGSCYNKSKGYHTVLSNHHAVCQAPVLLLRLIFLEWEAKGRNCKAVINISLLDIVYQLGKNSISA